MNRAEFDGMSGARLGPVRPHRNAQVADNLIDAGYQIRIDSAVGNHDENRAEVKVPPDPRGFRQGKLP
jgi:hypothetical protein